MSRTSWNWSADVSHFENRVRIFAQTERGGERVVAELWLEEHAVEPGDAAPIDCTLAIEFDEAQQIMNALWQAGIRPKDGAGSVAHAEAQKVHLDDMRSIAFRLLDKVIASRDASPTE